MIEVNRYFKVISVSVKIVQIAISRNIETVK